MWWMWIGTWTWTQTWIETWIGHCTANTIFLTSIFISFHFYFHFHCSWSYHFPLQTRFCWNNNFIHMSTNQLQYVNFPQKGAVWNPVVTGQMGEYCSWTRLQDGIVANQVHLVVLKFHSLYTFWRIGTDLHILPACRVIRMDTQKVLYSACPVSVITRESTIQSAFWISICIPLGAVAISANTHFTKASELYAGSYHCFTRWASSTTKPTRYDWSMSFLNVTCHFLFPRSCSFLFTVQP